MKILICMLIVCLGTCICHAQQAKLDSLLRLNANYTKEDNTKLDILNKLADVYFYMQLDSGIVCADRAIALAEKLHNQRALGDSYTNKARLQTCKNVQYSQVEQLLQKALTLQRASGNSSGIATCYLNLSKLKSGDEKVMLLNKALDLYKQTNNLWGQGQVMILFAMYYYLGSNVQQSFENVEKARTLYIQAGDSVSIAECYITESAAFYINADYVKAIETAEIALKIGLATKTSGIIDGAYISLANVYNTTGNHTQAQQCYFNALKMAEKEGNIQYQSAIISNLANSLIQLKKYNQAIEYVEKGITWCKVQNDSPGLQYNYGLLAEIYAIQKRYPEAIIQYHASLQHGIESNIEIGECENYTGLSNAFIQLSNYDSAYFYIKKAITLNASVKSTLLDVQIYIRMATLLKNAPNALLQKMGVRPEKRYEVAIENINKCLAILKVSGELNYQSEALLLLSELYEKSGNTKASYDSYKQYTIIKDSILNKESSQSVANLQIQYETEKKEQQITLLNKDNELQTKELDKQKLVRNSFVAGFGVMLLFAGLFLFQRNKITKEKTRSDGLLLNILPAEVAEELKSKGTADAKHYDNVTVLFTDFKSFTKISEQLSPQELVDELHTCFKGFDEIMAKYSIEKIKTIGDAYLAVSGLPQADEHHAEHVVRAALEIREFMHKRRENLGAKTFEIRIGINSGSVVAGIVGVKKFAYDIWGDTVNTAARMEQNSEPGKINISETTYALVKEKFTCEYRGEIDAKNKGKLAMYFVENYRSVV